MTKLRSHFFLPLLILFLGACGSAKKVATGNLTFQEKKKFEKAYFEASKQKILGNNEQALKMYKKSLDIDPSCHACMYQIANVEFAMKNLVEAVRWGEKAVELNPEYNFWYYGQLGQFYNRSGQYEKSGEIFLRMAKAEPEKASNYFEAANQFINVQKWNKALDVLGSYEKRFGVNEESARKKEGIYFQLRKPDAANNAMLALTKVDKNNMRYKGLLAESYLRAGKIGLAESTYEEILEIEPTNGYAHFGLADVLRKKEQDEASFQHMVQAFKSIQVPVELKLKVVQSFYPYIRIDSSMNRKVFELTSILVDVNKGDPRSFIAHSDVLFARRDYVNARQNLLRALDLKPDDYNSWQQLIALDNEIHDFVLMEDDSRRFIENFPNQPLAYMTNAHSNLMLNRFQKAMEVSEEGLEISLLKDDKVQLLTTLATAAYELKKYDKSDEAHEELLEINPNEDLALNNYAYFLAERNIKLDKALEMVKRANVIAPNNISYMDTYAWVLYKMGQYEKALIKIEQVVKLVPDDPELLIHYREILIKLDRQEDADKVNEKIKLLSL